MNKRLLYIIFTILFASVVFAADSSKTTQTWILKPVLFYGIILGLYELFLIHADENFSGSHWFGHGFQAVGFMIVAIFFVMNVEYAMKITGFSTLGIPIWLKNPLTFQILIGIILNIKIHSVSAVIHTQGVAARGLAEHWSHTLLVSALVVIVPYAHQFIGQFLPVFFQ
jgi:hypothetical protein